LLLLRAGALLAVPALPLLGLIHPSAWKYRDRYDLDGLPDRIEAVVAARSRWSWRSVVYSRIRAQGAALEREIENEVSRILTIEDE
jgi:hypothetical protein